MKKRIFSLALTIALLCAMVPQFSVPAQAVEHTLDAFQVDGKTYSPIYGEKLNQILRGEVALFTNSDVRYPLGTSMNNNASYTVAELISGYQCYIYAQAVYYYLFGDVIYHGDGYKYWSDSDKVLHNEKTISYELFSSAKVGFGAYIRTTTSSTGAYNGEKGHSMIVLAYDSQSITFLEGNADGKGLVRITTQTWDEYNDIMLTSKGRRIAHVVQCRSAVCAHRNCTQLGLCLDCGMTFDFASTFRADRPGYYTVAAPDGLYLKADAPYEAADNSDVIIPADTQLEVLGRVTNALGETWFKLSWEGQTGYANAEHFIFVGYGEQEIRCTLTSPQEDEIVPRASYPVIGAVTSRLPLDQVVGVLDGEVFAVVSADGATYLDIRASAINQNLSFSKLSLGYHVLEIRARDIYHDEPVTVCTRRFITESADPTLIPGKPVLQYALEGKDPATAVFTWEATENAQYYTLTLLSKTSDGQWETFEEYPQAESGMRLELPAGQYSAQLQAYSAAGYDTAAEPVYMSVSVDHNYVLQASVQPTCNQVGREEYACSNCGDSYHRELPIVDHQYEDRYCIFCDIPEDMVYHLRAQSDSKTGKPVLSWNKVGDAKKYEIYRATSESGKYTRLTTTTKTTYTDTKATAGKQYFYKVRVTSSKSCAYNGQYSLAADCWTACARPVVTLKADAVTGNPSLSWKAVTKAIGYRIWRRMPGEEQFTVIAEVTGKTYLDTQVNVDTAYEYRVQAIGSIPALDSAFTATQRITALCAQPVVKATATDEGKPMISWTAVEGAVHYKIYRSTKATKSYTLLETVMDTTFTDDSAAAGKTYYYKVIAAAQISESAYSSYVKAAGKCSIPEVALEENDSGKPILSWSKVEGAKKYEIYRSVNGGSFKKLTTTTKLTYTDSKATGGALCEYKVRALGSASSYHSGYCQILSCNVRCKTPAVKAKVDATTGLPSLSWSKITGAVSYAIYRSAEDSHYVLVGNGTGTSYQDAEAQPGVAYSYQVVAVGKEEVFNSAPSAEKTVTATCAMPKPKGKISAEGKPVVLWTDVEGAQGYAIYRSTSKSSGYKLLKETEKTTFTDSTAVKNKTYYYKIVALAGDTKSAQSGYVKLKAKK